MKLIEQINDLDAKILELQRERKALLDEWVVGECPYSVGDVVDVRGYSHAGKQCKVTKITWTQCWSGGYLWSVEGVVIVKDGTEGKLSAKWDQSREPKK